MAFNLATWGNSLHSGARSYPIVLHRGRWFVISGVLMALSVAFLVTKGLNPSIEFRGGSEFEISNPNTTSIDPAIQVIHDLAPTDHPRVYPLSSGAIRVEMEALDTDTSRLVLAQLATAYGVSAATDVASNLIGPTWGHDVTSKAIKALVIFLILVTAVMAAYFRTWRMALAALIALIHDLLFTVGVYAAIGFEVSPATVIGFLTILGYSLYDTVVVFDKVRENTKDFTSQRRYTHAELANLAVNQTLVRSINTSVVALLPVMAILFIGAFVLGAGTLKDISLALFVGLAVGTYSSIFVATPFEVALRDGEEVVAMHTREVLEARAAAGLDPSKPAAAPRVGAIRAGEHRGIQAQPRRKRRS